jgi:predicted ATPase
VEALVTSRAALHIRGERMFPVPPLGLPDQTRGHIAPAALAGYEAVRLFVDRARSVRPEFALTDETATAVVEICTRLDGLPLAIELAAARLQLFSARELRDRLRDRLDTLRGGSRDVPSRQRTLRSTIEWSDELLDDDERALFHLLSVFSATRVEAIEEVAHRVDALHELDVLDRLASLVDKNLVRSIEDGGARRLSMLETIRDYAAERLEAEPFAVDARRAHAEYFADLANGMRHRLSGSDRATVLDALTAELGDLMTAWRYWAAARNLERLDMLLDGLWALHDARGWYHGALELTNDLLEVLSAVPSTPERALEEITVRTSLARGLMAIRGYTEEVAESYGRALALVEEAGGVPERFPVLRSLASLHLYRAEFDKGVVVGRQLLDLAEQQQDTGLQVEGHLRLGANLASLGDVDAGLDHLERAIELFDPHRQASSRFHLGPSPGVTPQTTSAFLLWLRGYPDRAGARAADALETARRLDQPYTLAYALFHVGFLDLWRRNWELVHERATEVLEIAEEHEYDVWQAIALVLDGAAHAALGRADEGVGSSDRGLTLYREMKTPPVFWPLLLSIRARTYALADRPADGLPPLDEAIGLMAGRANILYPEMPVLKGDLLLALSDTDGAMSWYRTAVDVAREVTGRMSELRAATRLTRLLRASGARRDEGAELRRVFDTFTEGFETLDLVEARAVLDAS